MKMKGAYYLRRRLLLINHYCLLFAVAALLISGGGSNNIMPSVQAGPLLDGWGETSNGMVMRKLLKAPIPPSAPNHGGGPGRVSQHKFGNSFKKMCKEGAYWGTVAGVYAGMEYGVERIRGERDWKNAMVGGALSGALISAASSNNREKIVMDAITGGAIATAAEFLNHLK